MLAFAQSPELWQSAAQILRDQYNIAVCHDESIGMLVKSYFVHSAQRAMVLCRLTSVTPADSHGAAQSQSSKQEDDKVEPLLNSPIEGRAVKEEDKEENQTSVMTLTDSSRLVKKEDDDSKGEGDEDEDEDEEAPPKPEYVLRRMKWNMPSWAGDGTWTYPIARAESMNNRPLTYQWMWTKKKGRCVIVCDGYYQKLTKKQNTNQEESAVAFVRYADRSPLLLAGLYHHDPSDPIPYRFCVISSEKPQFSITTTEPDGSVNPQTTPLALPGERQPVILSTPEDVKLWLDTSSGAYELKHARLLESRYHYERPFVWYLVPSATSPNDPATMLPSSNIDFGEEVVGDDWREQI
ncbi:unnamed protein product [Cyclocybe aegerita]|uniref:DUF159-domain-containing protein n=1 Tax=Cyclocybe aegerita TaxID=1973307 RepID=A0A8S0XW36_CYCAE|nr:unnamed protein product [Cyclocybe aegerita]